MPFTIGGRIWSAGKKGDGNLQGGRADIAVSFITIGNAASRPVIRRGLFPKRGNKYLITKLIPFLCFLPLPLPAPLSSSLSLSTSPSAFVSIVFECLSSALKCSQHLDYWTLQHFAIVVETNINAVGHDVIIVDKKALAWRREIITAAAMILIYTYIEIMLMKTLIKKKKKQGKTLR